MTDPTPLSVDPFATSSSIDPLPEVPAPVVEDVPEVNMVDALTPTPSIDPVNSVLGTTVDDTSSNPMWRTLNDPNAVEKDSDAWMEETQAKLDREMEVSPFPDDELATAFVRNDNYLMKWSDGQMDLPDYESPERQAMLRQAANELFGESIDQSSVLNAEKSFHKLAMTHWKKDKAQQSLDAAIKSDASDMALSDIVSGTRTKYDSKKYDKLVAESGNSHFDAGMAYDKVYKSAAGNIAPYASELAVVFSTMQGAENFGGFAENMKRWMPGPARSLFGVTRNDTVSEAAFKIYDSLPDDKKPGFIGALGAVAKLLPPKQSKTFWQGFTENASGAAESVGRAMQEGITETGLQVADVMPGGRMGPISGGMPPMDTSTEAERKATVGRLRAENLRRINFAADVRHIAASRDMVDITWGGNDNSWFLNSIETGLLAAPEAIGTTVVAAVPYVGIPATTAIVRGKIYESMRQDLIAEGMDAMAATTAADDIATIAAVPEMLLEKLQARILTKGATGMTGTGWITKAWHAGLSKATARFPGWLAYTGRVGVGAVEEAITETAQDVSQQVVRDAYRVAMQTFSDEATKEMPNVDWGKFISELPETFVQNLAAVGPMGIISAMHKSGVVTTEDVEATLNEVREATRLDNTILTPGRYTVAGGTSDVSAQLLSNFPESYTPAGSMFNQEENLIHEWVTGIGPAPAVAEEDVSDAAREFSATLHSALGAMSMMDPLSSFDVRLNENARLENGKLLLNEVTRAVTENHADTNTSTYVTGWSETSYEGGRRTVNTLVNGASAITAYHELGHGMRNAAVSSGRLSREEQIVFFRTLDKVIGSDTSRSTGDRSVRFLPANKSDTELSEHDLSEAFSGLMEVRGVEQAREGRKADKEDSTQLPSVLRRNLNAMLRLAAGPTRKIVALVAAAKANFGMAMVRARRIRQAISRGEITRDEINEYIDRVMGSVRTLPADGSTAVQGREYSTIKDPAEVGNTAKYAKPHLQIRAATEAVAEAVQALSNPDPNIYGPALQAVRDITGNQNLQLADAVNSYARSIDTQLHGFIQRQVDAALGSNTDLSGLDIADIVRNFFNMYRAGGTVGTAIDTASGTPGGIIRPTVAAMIAYLDVRLEALGDAETPEAKAKQKAILRSKSILDMIGAASSMRPGSAEAVAAKLSVAGMLANETIDLSVGVNTALGRLLDTRFAVRDGLVADTASVVSNPKIDREQRERDSKLNKFGSALASLRSFGGVLRAAFGHNSAHAERLLNGIATAELNESAAKYAVYEDMNSMLASLWGGVDSAGYRAFRAVISLHDVSDKRKAGVEASRLVDGSRTPKYYSQMQAVHAVMMYRQADGKSHMQAHGYDDVFIKQLTDGLSAGAKTVMDWLSRQYTDRMYNRLNKVYRARVGTDMPRIPFYCPLTCIPETDLAPDMLDPVTGAHKVNQAGFTPASLITRVHNASAEPDLTKSALDVFKQHVEQAEHWINFADISELLKATLTHKSVQEAVKNTSGTDAASQLTAWANHYYNRGDRNASQVLAYHTFMRRMLNNLQGAILLGRVGTLLIQSMNMLAPSLQVSTKQYLMSFLRILRKPGLLKSAWQSDFMLQRRRDSDTAIQEMKGASNMSYGWASRSLRGLGRFQYYTKEILGGAITNMDAIFSTVAYANVMVAVREDMPGASETQLHDECVKRLDQVLQPTRTSQRSLLELNQGPWLKSVWAFASEPRQKLMFMLDSTGLTGALTGTRTAKSYTTGVRTVVWGWLAAGLMQAFIRGVWRDMRDDDDKDDDGFFEDWKPGRVAADTILWPLDGLPVIGDGLQSSILYAVNRVFPGSMGTIFGDSTILSNVTKAGRSAARLSDEEDMSELDRKEWLKYTEDILGGTAILGSAPSAAASLSHILRDFFRLLDTFNEDD